MTELVMCLTRQCVCIKQTTRQGLAFGFQTIASESASVRVYCAELGSQLLHTPRYNGKGLGCATLHMPPLAGQP
jgi:hypothetical protein